MIPNIKIDTSLFGSFDNINAAIDSANTAMTTSENAVDTANTALGNSISTQDQLDTIVLESGTSDAEVLQARTNNRGKTFDVLRDYLNELDIEFRERAVNVKWYGASGSPETTTGSIDSGSNTLTVAKLIDFEVGQGVAIVGAGASGGLLISAVNAIDSATGTMILRDSAGTTVSGAKVEHEDSEAVQAAIDSFAFAGVLEIPGGQFNLININVYKPIVVRGVGMDTVITPSDVGYIFDIYREPGYDNRENHLQGFSMSGMKLWGKDRTVDAGAFKLTRLDHSLFSNMWVEDFRRESFNFYASVRETTFLSVHTRYCGDADRGYPDVNITENENADGHNNIFFDNCFFIYSFGTTIKMGSLDSTTGDVRHIKFNLCMLHGYVPNATKYTMTETQKATSHLEIESVSDVIASNTRMHVGGKGVPTVHILSDGSHGDPERIEFAGCHVSEHYRDNGVGGAPGIQLDAGELTVDGTMFVGNTASIKSELGTTVHYGMTNKIVDAPPVFNGEAILDFYGKKINYHNADIANIGSIEATRYINNSQVMFIDNEDPVNQATALVFRTTNSLGELANRILISGGTNNPEIKYLTDFWLAANRKLKTSNNLGGTSVGNVVGKHPIYDDVGALIGYLPIYDNIT